MPKAKPLMTLEQQKLFKEAVANKAIEPVKYADYCKVTPEEAEKMLKAVADKLPKTQEQAEPEKTQEQAAPEKTQEAPAQEKKGPTIKDPESPATKFQKRAISDAVKAGNMEALPEEKWKALSKGEASRIISELHAKMPPSPATESQMKELDKLVKDGRIYPMKTDTFNGLSKDKASTLIGIGRMNTEKDIRVEGYDPNYVSKRNKPKTPEQEAEIKRLVAEKRLNPVPHDKWNELTQGEAGKLIYVGQQREAANELAPALEYTREKEPAAAPAKPQRPALSRADDMPM